MIGGHSCCLFQRQKHAWMSFQSNVYRVNKRPGFKRNQNNYTNMGELLVKIGFSTDDEIQWALNQKKKMLEKILKEKKLLN